MRSEGPCAREAALTVNPLPDCDWRPGPDQCSSNGMFPKIGCWISTGLYGPHLHEERSSGASFRVAAASTAAASSSSQEALLSGSQRLGWWSRMLSSQTDSWDQR